MDVVADAVLDTADENLSNFLAQLAANGLRAQRYNDLVAALVPGICADAAFDPDELASKFDVDPEGLLLLRSTVRREVDKLRATHALHKDDLTGNLSPEQLPHSLPRKPGTTTTRGRCRHHHRRRAPSTSLH